MQQDLVRQAQAGDQEAFAVIVRGALSRLYGTARLILRDSSLAEDAVQDALWEAWRDIRGLRDPDRIDAWLHRIVVRACYRSLGRSRRRDVKEIPLDATYERAGRDDAASLADRDEMERAFRRLTKEERTVVALVYYADMTVVDAAVVMGVPLGTAKSRLHRALASLRASLAADERLDPVLEGRMV